MALTSAPRASTDGLEAGQPSAKPNLFVTVMILALPLLAALGPLVAVAGPLWGFRVACLALGTYALLTRSNRQRSELKSRLIALICGWGLIMVALSMFVPLTTSGRTEVASISTGMVLIWAMGTLSEPRRLMALLPTAWLIAFAVTGAIAVREFFTGQHFSNYYLDAAELQRFEASNYVASTFGNPNNYAFFLCSAFPFLLVGAYRAGRTSTRLLFAAAAMAAFALVFLTGSRLGTGVLVLQVITIFLASGLIRKLAIILFGVLLIALLRVGAPDAFETTTAQVTAQVQATFGDGGEGLLYELRSNGALSAGVRLNLVRNGWDFSLDSALLGAGPGSFERLMSEGEGDYPTAGIVNPHSGWTEILVEYGLLIFILIGLFLAKIVTTGWRAFRRDGLTHRGGDGDFGLLTAGLAIGMPLLSMMNSTFLQPSVVWVLIACLYLCALALTEAPTAEAAAP